MQQDRSVEESAALLIPLLRCLGNMGSSKSAAQSLLSPKSTLAVSCCAESENVALQREAFWVMAMLNELSRGLALFMPNTAGSLPVPCNFGTFELKRHTELS